MRDWRWAWQDFKTCFWFTLRDAWLLLIFAAVAGAAALVLIMFWLDAAERMVL